MGCNAAKPAVPVPGKKPRATKQQDHDKLSHPSHQQPVSAAVASTATSSNAVVPRQMGQHPEPTRATHNRAARAALEPSIEDEIPLEPAASTIALPVGWQPGTVGNERFGPAGPRCGSISLGGSATLGDVWSKSNGEQATSLDFLKPSYNNVVNATADFLATRILNKTWVAQHDDLAFYAKAPMLLFEANRKQDARTALRVAAKYAERDYTNSCSKVYAEDYPHCAWLWICWAATQMSVDDLANRCFQRICSYQHRLTQSGLVREPYRSAFDFEADFFATAVCAKAALLRNDAARAEGAGDALIRAMDANRTNMSKRKRFNLRWRWHDGFLEQSGPTQCVLQAAETGQLHSMLGFPALVLLELSRTKLVRAPAYAKAALDLLHFLKGSHGVQNNREAHVVAAAAAAANDPTLATQIADELASQMSTKGYTLIDGAEEWETMDHAAEAAFWLCCVNRSLTAPTSDKAQWKTAISL